MSDFPFKKNFMVFVPLKVSDSVAVTENDDGKRTIGLHLVIYQTLLSPQKKQHCSNFLYFTCTLLLNNKRFLEYLIK